MTTKSFLESLPVIISGELRQLENHSKPETEFLYKHFKVDEIVLFEGSKPTHGRKSPDKAIREADGVVIKLSLRTPADVSPPPATVPNTPIEALVESYRSAAHNRSFVSIKWFRDKWLPEINGPWAKDPEQVRTLLAQAIERGLLRKEQIPNPNNPDHPTTVLKEGVAALERTERPVRRFAPMAIPGKPLSATVLEGR